MVCSALARNLWCFGSARKMQSSAERKSACSEPEESWFPEQKSLPLVPDWSVLMQMKTPNSHILIGPKGTESPQSDWSEDSQSCWLGLHSSKWMGKALTLLVEIGFQELVYKGWLPWQKHRAGRQAAQRQQFSAGFSLKCTLSEKPLCRNGC